MSQIIEGKAYVVGDNIDTDQIIPAQYLSLVPTVPQEYRKLGEYALCGLPRDAYPQRLVDLDRTGDAYTVVIAGRNFGCGSSREHAPIALGAAGVRAVVAEGFARIFFRNCIATGELYPVESEQRLCESIRTGDTVRIDLEAACLRMEGPGACYALKGLGPVKDVVAAGGLFAYARQTGMVGPRRHEA
jgi:3-isopropylmalate/(R)-2-methylmalate dehydratase small subunit